MSVRRPKRRREKKRDDESLWIYSYADMVSFLLIFFILFFNTNSGESAQEMAASIAQSFAGKVQEKRGGGDSALPVEVRDPDLKQLLLRKTQSEFEILLPGALMFRTGSERLSDRAPVYLSSVVEVARELPDVHTIEITGHTDSLPPSAAARYRNNWALSAARAGEVAARLVELGIDAKMIATSGVADSRPLYPEVDPQGRPLHENRAKNRRVQIVLKTHGDGGQKSVPPAPIKSSPNSDK